MTNLQSQFQTPLSSEEGLRELKEQDMKEATGGVVDPKPLLSYVEREGTGKAAPHINNGTYDPPGWYQSASTVNVVPNSNAKQHVFNGKNLYNTVFRR
jgi:hypothetical protein